MWIGLDWEIGTLDSESRATLGEWEDARLGESSDFGGHLLGGIPVGE